MNHSIRIALAALILAPVLASAGTYTSISGETITTPDGGIQAVIPAGATISGMGTAPITATKIQAGPALNIMGMPLAAGVQDKIQAITAQIQKIQEQIGQIQAGMPAVNANPINPGATLSSTVSNLLGGAFGGNVAGGQADVQPGQGVICPKFIRTIAFGAQGDDVAELQQFLADQGVFTAKATGFFGPVTLAAVQKFQADTGIVSAGDPATTGWGNIGPATRSIIGKRCGGGNDRVFSASPRSGTAPLTVQFSGTVPARGYSLDFGDGSPVGAGMAPIVECFAAPCQQPETTEVSIQHTYTATGNYVAKLTYQPSFKCPAGAMCAQVMPAEQTRTVTIHVGTDDTRNGQFNASPTAGTAPLAVSFSYPIDDSNNNAKLTVEFGDGTSAQMDAHRIMVPCAFGVTCPTRGSWDVSHTYTKDGTYTAQLMLDNCPTGAQCFVGPRSIGSVTIRVGSVHGCPVYDQMMCPVGKHYVSDATTIDANNCQIPHGHCEFDSTTGAPSVTGVDGPASLNVGQQGTWSVHATVRGSADQNLHYSVTWGDEADVITQLMSFAADTATTFASGTFTHAYSTSGIYVPRFTVSNSAGKSAVSASVAVGTATDVPVSCPAIARLCPEGSHAQREANTCNQLCVPDTKPLCPMIVVDCAMGYHPVGQGTGTDGCALPAKCVADTSALCPVIAVDCAAGYHRVSTGTGSNGCALPDACVVNSNATIQSATNDSLSNLASAAAALQSALRFLSSLQ